MSDTPKPSVVLFKTPHPLYGRVTNISAVQFQLDIGELPMTPILFDTAKHRLVISSNGYELIFAREDV